MIYRLPTDAEREYACRAGTTTTFHFGNQLTKQQAIIFNCHRRPTTVGSYAPNAFGLYNMHGNVGEWCNDWARDYAKSPPSDDPQGTFDATRPEKAGRGGSWACVAKLCRSAARFSHVRSGGFRVAAIAAQ